MEVRERALHPDPDHDHDHDNDPDCDTDHDFDPDHGHDVHDEDLWVLWVLCGVNMIIGTNPVG